MADYGQAGALAYAIPQKFLSSQQPPGSSQASAPGAIANQGIYDQPEKDLLAEREGLTDNYYNNYGVLDSYTKDMAKKGINVFEPDYTQPGGGEAFKTFQRMQANVMHAANALKGEFEAEKKMREQEMTGHARIRPNVDREGLYYSKPENFYSTAISPTVTAANQAINQETNTPGDAANVNKKIRGPELQHLLEIKQRLINEGKPTDEIDNDIAALSTNVDRQDPSVMAAYARKSGSGGAKYDTSIFKKLYNIGSASWKPGTYKIEPHHTHGAVWSYDGLKGDKYGTYRDTTNPDKPVLKEKVIEKVYTSPKDKTITVSFQDKSIPDEVITDPYHFAENVISHNPKHGDFARTMRAVYDEGMGDSESGGVVPGLVLDPNIGKYQNEMIDKMGTQNQAIEQVQNTDRDKLKNLKDEYFKRLKFPTPKGELTVKRNGDTYQITNFDDFWPDDYSDDFKGLTSDQVIKKLNELGVYDKITPAAPGKQFPRKLSIEKNGKKSYLEADDQSDIDEAIKQGYKILD